MLSVPIGVALGVATSLTICLTSNIGPVMVAQKAFTGLDSFTLIAIPFFMLAGNLMALGGIARRIVNLADAAVGKFTGGLGHGYRHRLYVFCGHLWLRPCYCDRHGLHHAARDGKAGL